MQSPVSAAPPGDAIRLTDAIARMTGSAGKAMAATAKLDAAHQLGVRVIRVRRPAAPDGVPEVGSTADAVAWLAGLG